MSVIAVAICFFIGILQRKRFHL